MFLPNGCANKKEWLLHEKKEQSASYNGIYIRKQKQLTDKNNNFVYSTQLSIEIFHRKSRALKVDRRE